LLVHIRSNLPAIHWAVLCLGGKNTRHDLTYPQFSQMMRALRGEKVRQAFHYFDPKDTSFIEPEQFQRIFVDTQGHKLSNQLLDNLHTMCNIGSGSKISYANVRAFQNIVRSDMTGSDIIIDVGYIAWQSWAWKWKWSLPDVVFCVLRGSFHVFSNKSDCALSSWETIDVFPHRDIFFFLLFHCVFFPYILNTSMAWQIDSPF
jgi:hypothetical protein